MAEEGYEVERIVDSRKSGKTHEYLIKWKNYPSAENTWEPEENLEVSFLFCLTL